MDLGKSCEKGKIGIDEFFEFAVWQRPRRTHLLDIGDYVVFSHPYKRDHVDIEKIFELDFPEKGDFLTNRGSIGPINGNVFIKINRGGFPHYLLVEGDRIGEPACPIPVYKRLNSYVKRRCNRN